MNRHIGMALVATILLFACRAPTESDRGLPLADFEIGRRGDVFIRLEVEIAETDEARARGLMGVKTLAGRKGMVFLLDGPGRSPFWMKDTLIPLDIAFWDGRNLIVDTFTMDVCKAEPCPLYTPASDYVGAVEMNRGMVSKAGARRGDTISVARRR